MNDQFQINLLRLQADLHTRLRNVGDVRKALVHGVRAARNAFGAEDAAIATLRPGKSKADLIFTIPRDARWDTGFLTQYIAGDRPTIPWNMLLAPVTRRGRNWAVLVLRDKRAQFTTDQRQALFSVTQILTDIVQALDDERTRRVRRKIEAKIADRGEPKDLIYNILHGLRSLTDYDHSASLLVSRDGSEPLELVAEQIAWTKAKSKRIGLRLGIDEELSTNLRKSGVSLFERSGGGWRAPGGASDPPLPGLLEHAFPSSANAPTEVEMICAPFTTPDGAVGVLKISARRKGVLGDYEAERVDEFMPLTSLAVQFSMRTESLQERILQSERKHALANLTRGITHDVNNALGAMLPLVQQMREDIRTGKIQTSTFTGDLETIENSIQTCRRIFSGMLAIARGSGRGAGHGNLRRAIDAALSVVEDSLKRHSIEVVLGVPEEIPTIKGSHGDLTQLFLNLCMNARDAMPRGGLLTIAVVPKEDAVEVTIQDNGEGIPSDLVGRIMEPFFTTRAEGNGLGLSICRSILWDIGGDLDIESEDGKGTRVHVSLPILKGDDEGEAE
jgi:two-component system NtrC family sensor kinase